MEFEEISWGGSLKIQHIQTTSCSRKSISILKLRGLNHSPWLELSSWIMGGKSKPSFVSEHSHHILTVSYCKWKEITLKLVHFYKKISPYSGHFVCIRRTWLVKLVHCLSIKIKHQNVCRLRIHDSLLFWYQLVFKTSIMTSWRKIMKQNDNKNKKKGEKEN